MAPAGCSRSLPKTSMPTVVLVLGGTPRDQREYVRSSRERKDGVEEAGEKEEDVTDVRLLSPED